ncbi:MAG: type II toxin-antitoxin system RelE/ParE family toxin [Deltaproteobacteria bacterium]|nr:type II toxin-antitoxin system RelE/ParE family toxin [Deltaproteobacteria bacterium]
MPRVIITEQATLGLENCRQFLAKKNYSAANNVGWAIASQFIRLESDPIVGRTVENHTGLRELVIPFGKTGYVALYRYDIKADLIVILAFRYQKEIDYMADDDRLS